MTFLTWLQTVLPQETLREKDSIVKPHHSSFQKGLGRVVTTKCSKVMAQNVKQDFMWIRCRFWKGENNVTLSTSLGNIFWSFFIYNVIYITSESWKYLVFTQTQQYIPPWNKFLHITKTMFFIYFSRFFHGIRHLFSPPCNREVYCYFVLIFYSILKYPVCHFAYLRCAFEHADTREPPSNVDKFTLGKVSFPSLRTTVCSITTSLCCYVWHLSSPNSILLYVTDLQQDLIGVNMWIMDWLSLFMV